MNLLDQLHAEPQAAAPHAYPCGCLVAPSGALLHKCPALGEIERQAGPFLTSRAARHLAGPAPPLPCGHPAEAAFSWPVSEEPDCLVCLLETYAALRARIEALEEENRALQAAFEQELPARVNLRLARLADGLRAENSRLRAILSAAQVGDGGRLP